MSTLQSAGGGTPHLLPFSRSRNSLPVLKKGTHFSSTSTDSPVRGLRPVRAGRFLTENAPKPRKFDAVAVGKRIGDLFEDRADDVFDVAQKQMRISCGDDLHEFGFDHKSDPRQQSQTEQYANDFIVFFNR